MNQQEAGHSALGAAGCVRERGVARAVTPAPTGLRCRACADGPARDALGGCGSTW